MSMKDSLEQMCDLADSAYQDAMHLGEVMSSVNETLEGLRLAIDEKDRETAAGLFVDLGNEIDRMALTGVSGLLGDLEKIIDILK